MAGSRTRLVPGGSYLREGVEATVPQDGRIYVGDKPYDYPSAAGYAAHGSGVNGWWYWAIAGTERRLHHVREEYLASFGDNTSVAESK